MAAPHVLIVEARFYEAINDELVKGATAELEAADASFDHVVVPGAFEIPVTVRIAVLGSEAGGQHYDAYVALGCVIRGETTHYDYICAESARGLMDLGVRHGLAIGYGILTCENGEQAMERARVDRKNKGGDAVRAALAMAGMRGRFGLARS